MYASVNIKKMLRKHEMCFPARPTTKGNVDTLKPPELATLTDGGAWGEASEGGGGWRESASRR